MTYIDLLQTSCCRASYASIFLLRICFRQSMRCTQSELAAKLDLGTSLFMLFLLWLPCDAWCYATQPSSLSASGFLGRYQHLHSPPPRSSGASSVALGNDVMLLMCRDAELDVSGLEVCRRMLRIPNGVNRPSPASLLEPRRSTTLSNATHTIPHAPLIPKKSS